MQRIEYIPNFKKDYVDVTFEFEGSVLYAKSMVGKFSLRFAGASDLKRQGGGCPVMTSDDNRASVQNWLNLHNPNLEMKDTNTNFLFLQMNYFICSTVVAYFQSGLKEVTESKEERTLKLKPDFFNTVREEENKYRVAHMYDGWDLVSMTESEYRQLLWYVYVNNQEEVFKNGIVDHSLAKVILPRFAFRVESENTDGLISVYYYNQIGSRLHITVDKENIKKKAGANVEFDVIEKMDKTDNGKYEKRLTIAPDSKLTEANIPWLDTFINGEGDKKMTVFQSILECFFAVQDFLSLPTSKMSMDVEERICETSSVSKKHKAPEERHVVRFFRKYTLKKGWLEDAGTKRKPTVYTCEAWGVKGHYRHLKDGRSIFVNAYVKGKNKSKYVGKEYLIRSPL